MRGSDNSVAADARSERIAHQFERPLLIAAVLTVPVTILHPQLSRGGSSQTSSTG